ncbi:TPA: helix-turn-helix domain-containing protein [Pseudomonas putida]|uniref:LexA family protein n=1 Tax=Pseudomonas putida TaxID=303 RepID=UPI002363D29F|nr:XRE family transcriptional regulator [Pseudomonas putida]MDD2149940.1 XRE family transcriptional regulator [Pseudomonas putida]HDS1682147.1 helix-turn-helix domain-containing protein [Pseudomonas putida]
MSTLQERLRQIMAGPPKISQAALARACGIKPPSVNDWLSGKTKTIEGQNLLLAADFLGVAPKWLATGRGPVRKSAGLTEGSNVEAALQPTRSFSYPEISWVQAGAAREAVEMGNVALCPQHTSDVWAGEDAFWLRVTGDSMTVSSGSPSFPEGFLILIAPDIEPRPGQFVVARMISTNEATFKQLVRDAGELYLKPLNSSYPTRAVDDTWEIVGTVVDGKMPKSIFL